MTSEAESRARLLRVLRKHLDGVSFFGEPGDYSTRLVCEDAAAACGISLRELFAGTRYEATILPGDKGRFF
jgi:hypothetical protein